MAENIDPVLQAAFELIAAGEIPPHLFGRLEQTLEGAFAEIDELTARVTFLELSIAAMLKRNDHGRRRRNTDSRTRV